ncbi:MAG: adenylyltransferase/cytidyltransferase family protein [Bacteroidales bacterium]
MRIFRSFQEAAVINAPVVTTGTFDGVHIGHRTIINRLKKLASEHSGERSHHLPSTPQGGPLP